MRLADIQPASAAPRGVASDQLAFLGNVQDRREQIERLIDRRGRARPALLAVRMPNILASIHPRSQLVSLRELRGLVAVDVRDRDAVKLAVREEREQVRFESPFVVRLCGGAEFAHTFKPPLLCELMEGRRRRFGFAKLGLRFLPNAGG
jgi:hypothetical protein